MDLFRLPQHVDKAGSDHHARGIDGLFRVGGMSRWPIAAMWPSRIATSAAYHGEPVPSMIVPVRGSARHSFGRTGSVGREAGE